MPPHFGASCPPSHVKPRFEKPRVLRAEVQCHPVVIAYHVIFSMYGFWLPNDPRGSWSHFVGSWELFRYGPATKVDNYRSYAHDPHDRHKRLAAKEALKYPPVVLSGAQALSVATGLAKVARSSGYRIHAFAILPEHGHLVLGRHHYKVEQVVRRLKQAAGKQLELDELHPFAGLVARRGALPTPFAAKCWHCFIDTDEYTRSAIRYVERNPQKEGKPRQKWSFVVPWEGTV